MYSESTYSVHGLWVNTRETVYTGSESTHSWDRQSTVYTGSQSTHSWDSVHGLWVDTLVRQTVYSVHGLSVKTLVRQCTRALSRHTRETDSLQCPRALSQHTRETVYTGSESTHSWDRALTINTLVRQGSQSTLFLTCLWTELMDSRHWINQSLELVTQSADQCRHVILSCSCHSIKQDIITTVHQIINWTSFSH